MCTADDSTGYYRPTWGYYFDGTGYSLCQVIVPYVLDRLLITAYDAMIHMYLTMTAVVRETVPIPIKQSDLELFKSVKLHAR